MTQQLINEMFYVLPAGSYQEIAERLSSRLGREVDWSDVNTAIADLRKAPALYGWTIPHCKRGPYVVGRLFAVHVNEDGTRVLSSDDARRTHVGNVGTLGHVHTMLGNAAETMQTAEFHTPTLRRLAQSMIRDMKYLSEKAWEMREDCRNAT